MEWLKDFIKNNPITALFATSSLVSFNFFANLFTALSDGKLDTQELHELLATANGFELTILIGIILLIKWRG